MSKISELIGNCDNDKNALCAQKIKNKIEVLNSRISKVVSAISDGINVTTQQAQKIVENVEPKEFLKALQSKLPSVCKTTANADDMMNNVDHPSHYQTSSGIEVIDVIEAFDLGFNLGNVIKYCLRCGKKTDNEIQELEKARWYLEREIENRKSKQ